MHVSSDNSCLDIALPPHALYSYLYLLWLLKSVSGILDDHLLATQAVSPGTVPWHSTTPKYNELPVSVTYLNFLEPDLAVPGVIAVTLLCNFSRYWLQEGLGIFNFFKIQASDDTVGAGVHIPFVNDVTSHKMNMTVGFRF